MDYRLNRCDSNGLTECLVSKIKILETRHRNDKKAFIVNLDDIWQWLGISRKDNAKKLLFKNFKENEDFIIMSDEKTAPPNGGAKV